MRVTGARKIFYTSGSGVYGEAPAVDFPGTMDRVFQFQRMGPASWHRVVDCRLLPYVRLFWQGISLRQCCRPSTNAWCRLRFRAVFKADPTRLRILGDGTQKKSYIHIQDILNAIFTVADEPTLRYDVFNVATEDYITVREIADLAVE